jgi:hypothetical protein
MLRENLKKHLKQKPFRPLTLATKDGLSFAIRVAIAAPVSGLGRFSVVSLIGSLTIGRWSSSG